MTLEFIEEDGRYIKQWPNWNGEVPQRDDVVVLHFGDYNEEEVPRVVKGRVVDGTKRDKVIIVLRKTGE